MQSCAIALSAAMTYLGETGISLPRHTYRSPTALEGIAMLKRGCIATKYGRAGKPHKGDVHAIN